MKHFALLFAGLLLSGFIFTNTSCRKDTACKATIRCIADSSGTPVGNAYVELFAVVKNAVGKTDTADVKAHGTTDNSGVVQFTFILPAIYDVRATLATSTKTLSGIGIIKLEEGQNVEKEIVLKKP